MAKFVVLHHHDPRCAKSLTALLKSKGFDVFETPSPEAAIVAGLTADASAVVCSNDPLNEAAVAALEVYPKAGIRLPIIVMCDLQRFERVKLAHGEPVGYLESGRLETLIDKHITSGMLEV